MKKIMASVLVFLFWLPLHAQVTPAPAVRAVIPEPPRAISPAPGESRSLEEPLMFRWAPVFLSTGKQASYRLTIAPVFADQSASEALEQNQPLFNMILSQPSYEYEPGSQAFRVYPMAVGFAWQVQAVDTGGHPVAANLGKSAVSSFTMVSKIPPPVVKKIIPETLIAGTFRIDVEEYDQPSKSVNPKLPSGIGRVRFTCPPIVLPFPWKNIRPVLKTYSVVESVTDSNTQVHVSEALVVNPSLRSGDKLQISLPQRSEASQSLVDRNLVIGLLKGLKGPGGIRVRFRDVEWTGALNPVVVLSEGIAWYPAAPVSPPVPAQVGIEPGFSLAIDSLVITPAKASVRGSILLPPCIISATACTRASIGLPWTAITGQCELYHEVPDSTFGPWYVGETGLQISGKGYTIDFSSVHSDPSVSPPLGNLWKGVVLKTGTTPDPPAEMVLSNRGYVKAKYSFANGLIVPSGLQARLDLSAPFGFRTVEPMGYLVVLRPGDSFLNLGACGVQGGQFLAGEIQLPIAALRDESGGLVRAHYDTLHVQNDMDLFGAVKVPGGFTWGEFSRPENMTKYYQLGTDLASAAAGGYFYLAARQLPPYYPLVGNVFTQPTLIAPEVQLEAQGIQGVTLTSLGHRQFTIWTQDVPGTGTILSPRKLAFAAESVFPVWMN
ncbi:MAG TPA: hypothetical protein VK569_08890, partial [Bacteroidota bacterium]|nr:hypothetical protein [Bacteroidota bacterium]